MEGLRAEGWHTRCSQLVSALTLRMCQTFYSALLSLLQKRKKKDPPLPQVARGGEKPLYSFFSRLLK